MSIFTKPASDFLEIPLVKGQIAAAAVAVGRETADKFADEMRCRLEANAGEAAYMELGAELAFDSPLEVAFWVWWRAAQRIDVFCEHNIKLARQVEIDLHGTRYVIDFVVLPVAAANADYIGANWPLIGIELDGHAFHEKTLEQVTYRNQRDRALQQAGWRLFHFSFAEFTRRPEVCLWEVVEFVRAAYWDVAREQVAKRAEAAAHNQKAAPAGDVAR